MLTPWEVGQASPVHLTPDEMKEFAASLQSYIDNGWASDVMRRRMFEWQYRHDNDA